MSSKERTADLVKYRLQNSKEKLGSAKLLLENGKFKDSISRSYYAMFDGFVKSPSAALCFIFRHWDVQ